MKLFIVIFLYSFSFLNADSNELNFKHKTILKALEKYSISFENDLEEFTELTNINSKFYKVKQNNFNISTIYIGRVNSCKIGGCSNPSQNTQEAYEYFDYMIIFQLDTTAYTHKQKVFLIKIFNYKSSAGHEICSKSWLKQFIGYNGSEDLTSGKQIDAISGATTSVDALITDVELRTYIINNYEI